MSPGSWGLRALRTNFYAFEGEIPDILRELNEMSVLAINADDSEHALESLKRCE